MNIILFIDGYLIVGILITGLALLWAKYIRKSDVDCWIHENPGLIRKLVDILECALAWPLIMVGLVLVSVFDIIRYCRGNNGSD